MHKALHAWDNNILKKPKSRLQQAQREYEEAMNGPLTEENTVIAKELSNLIELLLEQEEVHWMQTFACKLVTTWGPKYVFFLQFCPSSTQEKFHKKTKEQ
jgi:hypothetical protein